MYGRCKTYWVMKMKYFPQTLNINCWSKIPFDEMSPAGFVHWYQLLCFERKTHRWKYTQWNRLYTNRQHMPNALLADQALPMNSSADKVNDKGWRRRRKKKEEEVHLPDAKKNAGTSHTLSDWAAVIANMAATTHNWEQQQQQQQKIITIPYLGDKYSLRCMRLAWLECGKRNTI